MILVDKEIRKKVSEQQLILSDYNEKNLNGVSYDLTLDQIYADGCDATKEYKLAPGEVVFVKSVEKLKIPYDILGRIGEKNSLMRLGLRVDGPHFQPGHVTYAFLRVQNISKDIFILKEGMKIAQIFFEQLSEAPEKPYSAQENASFQDEVVFRGVGNYKDEYEKQARRHVDEVKEDLDNLYIIKNLLSR